MMLSFGKIATVFALTLGTFVSATPVALPERSHAVDKRASTSIDGILTTVTSDINTVLAELGKRCLKIQYYTYMLTTSLRESSSY